MICVSGFSGTGKDEFCRRLVEGHGAVHTGLADPAKRHMADIYGFTRDQLFGPSQMRNAGDPRYPKTVITEIGARPAEKSDLLLDKNSDRYTDPEKNWWCAETDLASPNRLFENMTVVWGDPPCVMLGSESLPAKRLDKTRVQIFFGDTDPRFFLSPREALQLYCDLMNQLYLCTWVRAGVDVHRKLAEWGDQEFSGGAKLRWVYDRMEGLKPNDGSRFSDGGDVITCFSDFRHWHEIRYVREAERNLAEGEDFKAVLIRVKRPGVEKPPFNHRSETEQATIPDSEFDYVVDNNDTISGLHAVVDTIVSQVKGESK